MSTTLTPPKSKLLTAAEFAARHENDRAELVDGVVVELPMPEYSHGKLCLLLGGAILNWITEHDLGTAASNDAFIRTRTDPDRVRGPDVCYYSYKRLPRGSEELPVMTIPPDLVVEVRSPTDRWNSVLAKAAEYLAAGVTAVVLVNPQTQSVVVYRDEQDAATFGRADTLTVPDVLPGFTFPVARLFG